MSARNRLLVIDYEPRSLKRTLALLQVTGCTIRSASNAKEIDAALAEAPPVAAIIEPMIPGQDGFRLIRQVKRMRPEDPVYVVAASRIYRGPRFRGMAKEAGADLFLERPAHDDQILAALEKVLGGFTPAEEDESADTAISIEVDASPDGPSPSVIAAPPPAPAPAPARANPASTAPHEVRTPEAASIPRPSIPRPAIPRPAVPAAPAASGRPAGATNPRTTGASVPRPTALPSIEADPSEIDAALDRLLGPFGDGSATKAPVAAPAPAAEPVPGREPTARPQVADLVLDVGFEGRRPAPRPVTSPHVQFAFDDAVVGDSPRPVVIPTKAAPPPPVPVIEPISPENLGYDLVTGDSGNISAAPPPDDASDPRYMDFLLQEDPGTGPPPVDPNRRSRTGPLPITLSGERPLLPNPDDEDIDRILSRVFSPGADASGGIPGLDAPSGVLSAHGAASSASPVPEVPPPPVPAGLRGMDAGTADLLSSLQELENSLPDGGPPSEFRPESTWSTTTGFGEATGQALREIETSVPFEPPPPPEEERTLEEVLSSVSLDARPTAEEITPPLSSPQVEFDAFRQTGVGLGVRGRGGTGAVRASPGQASRRPEVPSPSTVPSRSLMTGALVALLLLAIAVGGWYLFQRKGGEGDSGAPGTSTAEPRDFPVAPVPVAPRKKPKLKVKPANAAPAEPEATRPVPASEAPPPSRPPASPPKPSRETAATTSAANPAPVPRRAEPSPANASVFPNQRPPAVPTAPAGSEDSSPRSAADTATSAADMSAADSSVSAADMPIVRASELDAPIQAIRRTVPSPTPAAVEASLGGRAFLNVLVAGDGSVQEVRLMIDPGLGLGEAARNAAESWGYSRPTRQGKPVRVWKTEVVEFVVPAGDEE